MAPHKAIGFDLFNTLLTVHPDAMGEAHERLTRTLREEGLPVDEEPFHQAYVEAAKRFFEEARQDGRETHNRFWIADALERTGHTVPPDDPRIARVVTAYFSAFEPHCRLIPGTEEMLGALERRYRLGLLSNFTDGPAARRILDVVGLPRFFRTVLISGELGYRKPHPLTFEALVQALGVEPGEVLFVGDDPEADVHGALQAGLRPVLTTCARDAAIPSATTPLSHDRIDRPPEVPCISCWQDLLSLLEE